MIVQRTTVLATTPLSSTCDAILLRRASSLLPRAKFCRRWGSASDLEAVLGTVVQSARSLCRADVAQIHLMEGELLKLARSSGLSQEGIDYIARRPALIGDRSSAGSACTAGPADHRRRRRPGLRPTGGAAPDRPAHHPGVPMMLDDELVGVLNVWRIEVEPFGDRETEVLTVRHSSGDRHPAGPLACGLGSPQELSQKVDQLEALGEVGNVGSSLDPPCLMIIITRCRSRPGRGRSSR